jgi:hypothetical protein
MTAAASTEIRSFDSAEALAQIAAEWLCALALASDRDFSVCLSGGSTPRRLYERLATPAIASRFPWSRVHRFWGDERFVPHDDPDSNYRMARDALLSRVPIPLGSIHPIPTEGLSPERAAAAYEATLKRFHGTDVLAPDRPLFDVIPLPDHFECATASSPLSKHRSPGSDSIQTDLGSVSHCLASETTDTPLRCFRDSRHCMRRGGGRLRYSGQTRSRVSR